MEKDIKTLNPFGSNLIVEAADEKGQDKEKNKKKQKDLVSIHLACVPSLEAAKDDLYKVLENIEDEELKRTVNVFIDQIEKIEEQVLAITMQGIKNDRQSRSQKISPVAITPDMFSQNIEDEKTGV